MTFLKPSLRTLMVASLIGISQLGMADSFDYVGRDSLQARLSFSFIVEMNTGIEPTLDQARDEIVKQLDHLFGPMSYGEFKGVPKGNFRIRNIVVSAKNTRTYVASYSVSVTAALESRVKDTYTVTLPINPSKIYKAAMKGSENPCTDDHYQSEGDFWYFWSPERPGCELKRDVDYALVDAKVEAIANTEKTYAEFDRMADNDGVVTADLLWGLDDPTNSWNPDDSGDINAVNYRYVSKKLLSMGFTVERMNPEQISSIALKNNSVKTPTVDVFTKDYPQVEGRNAKKMVVTMFFGATGIDEESSAFHYFFKRALEKSSILVYAGHSGLGGHLDLNAIESARNFKIQLNKTRYQIFYFNSCTSYTYYNTMYFSRKKSPEDKKGTKNLDIVTNGLATLFSSIDETNLEMIRGVDNWAQKKTPLSFQEMARRMDSDNLLGVNGDEDNPTEIPSSN